MSAAKMMCERAESDDELRAITVDDSGEFRVWNVFVKERSSEPQFAPTLQCFFMHNPEPALNRFRFIVLPYDNISKGNYSNLVACSTKLFHFIPRKNAMEFCPPTCFLFHEYAAVIITAVGRSLLKYDLCTGHFLTSLSDICHSELTALSTDGVRGRRLFVGCNNGEILLVNFITGAIINRIEVHSAEVTCIVTRRGTRNTIYSSSLDGKLLMMEETSGEISVLNTYINAFGIGIGISKLIVRDNMSIMIVASTTNIWGVWNCTTFQRLMAFGEESSIAAIELIESSADQEKVSIKQLPRQHKKLLTLAVALNGYVQIYVVDIHDRNKTFPTFRLYNSSPIYITSMAILNCPDRATVNYLNTPHSDIHKISRVLLACADDGHIITWDISKIRAASKKMHRMKFNNQSKPNSVTMHLFNQTPRGHNRSRNSLSRSSISPSRGSNADLLPMISRSISREISSFFTTDLLEQNNGYLSDSSNDEVAVSSVQHSMKHKKSRKAQQGSFRKSIDKIDTNAEKSINNILNEKNDNSNLLLGNELNKSMDALNKKELVSAVSTPISSGSKGESALKMLKSRAPSMNTRDDGKATVAALGLATGRTVDEAAAATAVDLTSNKEHDASSPNATLNKSDVPGISSNNSVQRNVDSFLLIIPTYTLYNEDDVIQLQPRCSWRGHGDSACDVIALHEHSCFVTASHDGYLRVWNIDSECLGELPLPNMTEKMRLADYRLFDVPGWKFVLERMELGKAHRDLAAKLIADMTQGDEWHEEHPTVQRRGSLSSMQVAAKRKKSKFQNDMRADLRQHFLTALVLPHSIPDDAPPDRIPPRSHSPFKSPPSVSRTASCESLDHTKESEDNNNSPLKSVSLVGGKSTSSNIIGDKSIFNQDQLWTPAADGSLSSILVPPAAFSEASILMGSKQGLIDDEAHRILLKVRSEGDRVRVYDRGMPQLLLRSAELSTSVVVPPLDAIASSEVHFGPQRVCMYVCMHVSMYVCTRSFPLNYDSLKNMII